MQIGPVWCMLVQFGTGWCMPVEIGALLATWWFGAGLCKKV